MLKQIQIDLPNAWTSQPASINADHQGRHRKLSIAGGPQECCISPNDDMWMSLAPEDRPSQEFIDDINARSLGPRCLDRHRKDTGWYILLYWLYAKLDWSCGAVTSHLRQKKLKRLAKEKVSQYVKAFCSALVPPISYEKQGHGKRA